MSANLFHVCYGIRWEVDGSDDEEIGRLERREDPRILASRDCGLPHWWGSTADEGHSFLLIGEMVGHFGWEGRHAARLEDAEMVRVMDETRSKLRAAGFVEEPAWHFQFEPDR
jgi:hypothetical protein